MRNDVINMSRGWDKEKIMSRRQELNLAGPARNESFVAQWMEHPTGVRKVIGSISVGDSIFSLSGPRDMLITSFPKDQSVKLLFSTTECLDLPVPLNGRMSCQMFSGKKVCTLTCNDGYSYNTDTTPTYDCGPGTEWRWNGLEGFNVPACSSMCFFFYIQFFLFQLMGVFVAFFVR